MSNPTGDALAAIGIKDQQVVSHTSITDALRARRIARLVRRSIRRTAPLSLMYRFLRRRFANRMMRRREAIPYAP
jgi:hypothetical protein